MIRGKKPSRGKALGKAGAKDSYGIAAGFSAYQRLAKETIYSRDPNGSHSVIASMLGLASETGAILDSQKRYLRDSIDLQGNRKLLEEELGDLLWYVAAVATACGLDLGTIAETNLRRTRNAYKAGSQRRIQRPKLELHNTGTEAALPNSEMIRDISEYQRLAVETSRLNLNGPEGPIAPMLGLASTTGSILDCPKSDLPNFDPVARKTFFRPLLGDLLWYLAAVASASNLDLGCVAAGNLGRTRDLYRIPAQPLQNVFKALPNFDSSYAPTERFPRIIVISFEERPVPPGPPLASQKLVAVAPNAFPKGPIKHKQKCQGFKVGAPLGDATTDNSRRPDGYRYHDAIHWAFVAILGWSPTMRKLLQLKRRSNESTDRDEDGARAIYTEEGLAAILSRLAPRRMGFLGENTVDGQVIEMAKAAAQDLEVQPLPGWMWRRAISQGFVAMQELERNKGGYLKADLDERQLTFSKTKPSIA